MMIVPKLAAEVRAESLKRALSLGDGEVLVAVEPDGLVQIHQVHIFERSGGSINIYTAAICGGEDEAVAQAEAFCRELSKSMRCSVEVVRG